MQKNIILENKSALQTVQFASKSNTSYNFFQVRGFASDGDEIVVKVPFMGDSISEGTMESWDKGVGDSVNVDDVIGRIETDKVQIEVKAPEPGQITGILAKKGETVKVGADIVKIKKGAATAPKPTAPKKEAPKEEKKSAAPPPPSAKKESAPPAKEEKPVTKSPAEVAVPSGVKKASSSGTDTRVPMKRIRIRIAERLKDAQNTAAMLTTFQECDMSALMQLREQYKETFLEKHGIKLGFMSAFVKASAIALIEQPIVNAVIDGTDIVYHDYADIGVAVATPTGLVVPILRNCENKSFADIEKDIAGFGNKARKGQIELEDMAGGTFTISNGGVYGSLMGTPILNPPQSAILGMHAINKRAVVVTDSAGNDKIEIRPIMYLALSYDHRLIDGKDAVTFLRRIKFLIEDPRRIILDV